MQIMHKNIDVDIEKILSSKVLTMSEKKSKSILIDYMTYSVFPEDYEPSPTEYKKQKKKFEALMMNEHVKLIHYVANQIMLDNLDNRMPIEKALIIAMSLTEDILKQLK